MTRQALRFAVEGTAIGLVAIVVAAFAVVWLWSFVVSV